MTLQNVASDAKYTETQQSCQHLNLAIRKILFTNQEDF